MLRCFVIWHCWLVTLAKHYEKVYSLWSINATYLKYIWILELITYFQKFYFDLVFQYSATTNICKDLLKFLHIGRFASNSAVYYLSIFSFQNDILYLGAEYIFLTKSEIKIFFLRCMMFCKPCIFHNYLLKIGFYYIFINVFLFFDYSRNLKLTLPSKSPVRRSQTKTSQHMSLPLILFPYRLSISRQYPITYHRPITSRRYH